MFDMNELLDMLDNAGEDNLVRFFTTIDDLKRKIDKIREKRAIKATEAMNDFIECGGKMVLFQGGKAIEINTANTFVEIIDGKIVIDDPTFVN